MSLSAGWIGLGAMGAGMVSSLLKQGFSVKAYDVYPPSVEHAVSLGATRCNRPADAAVNAQVLALMVVNAAQVEEVLFGTDGAATALGRGSSVICFSTVPPSFLADVQKRLDKLGVELIDAPVSGGFARAAEGQLSVMVSSSKAAFQVARPVLEALTHKPNGHLAIVGDTVGQASDFKLINQVLCAIHIAIGSEAMALGTNLGCNPRKLYNAVRDTSFMFGHRGAWQLQNDNVPKSAMTIIHKDIGIVNDEARKLIFPAPLSAVAEQIFTAAVGSGLAKEDDGNAVKLWERFGGKRVAESGSVAVEEQRAAKASGGEEAIKLVRKLLHAVHTASAAEAMAFARRKGMDLNAVFDVVGTSAATSKPLVAFKEELSDPHRHDPAPGQPTVREILSDLDLVLSEAKRCNTPLFLGQAAQQRFVEAGSRGWGNLGGSVIGRLWP